MDRETALNTLRISDNASRSEIISAYTRLARRYPLQQFPERHTLLLQAKSLLLSPETVFKEMLMADTLDLGWLNPYTNTATTRREAKTPASIPQRCLEALFRPHLKKGADLFPESFEFNDNNDNFAQIINELDPEEIKRFN